MGSENVSCFEMCLNKQKSELIKSSDSYVNLKAFCTSQSVLSIGSLEPCMCLNGRYLLKRNTVKEAWSVERYVMENRQIISFQHLRMYVYEMAGDPITTCFKLCNNAHSRGSLFIVRQSLLRPFSFVHS